MLLTTISIDTDQNLLEKLLNIEESLIFIRQLTQIINKLNYYKLQDEQWTYYYNLGMTENIWTGRVSKNMAIVNSMCYTYGRSKVLIEQRHKKYKKNVQQIQIDIDEHMKQMPPPISTVDMDKLMAILIDLVHKDQYELRMELERRRDILKYDAKDHQLVHDFYQLKPRQTEVFDEEFFLKLISYIFWNIFRYIQQKLSGKQFMMNKYLDMRLLYLKIGSLIKPDQHLVNFKILH
jgi:hypothetical protein